MLRTSVCLLAGARLGAAQGSLADDVAVLLAFKAHGNSAQADGLNTWVSGVNPCDADGFAYEGGSAGWRGVACCDAYDGAMCTGSNTHRVTELVLGNAAAVDGDVSGLGGLAQLTYLDLGGTAVDGDVSGLGGLAQLSTLSLGYTAVDGDVSGLAGLAQLTFLDLYGTGCYGDSSVLPSSADISANHCSSSHDACPAGRTPVSSPDTYVGSNACACCSGTQKLLDSGTGACYAPGV